MNVLTLSNTVKSSFKDDLQHFHTLPVAMGHCTRLRTDTYVTDTEE